MQPHHLFFIFGFSAFVAFFLLIVSSIFYVLDRSDRRRSESPVVKSTPSMTSRLASYILQMIKESQERRAKALAELKEKKKLDRPKELWGPFFEPRIALLHRTFRFAQYRIVVSDYPDGKSSVTAISKSNKRIDLGEHDTSGRPDQYWIDLIRAPQAA